LVVDKGRLNANVAPLKCGDTYKACALTIKDSDLTCETGTNSPALRPEFKDLYLQEETAASQAAKISGEE
jgi:hypothetical protein